MSITKYSHSLMQHTRNSWSRRNSPASLRSPEGPKNFEMFRKRRQSAPASTLVVPMLLTVSDSSGHTSPEDSC